MVQANTKMSRKEQRIERINLAMTRMAQKIGDDPKNPKVVIWKRKIAEFEEELDVLALESRAALIRNRQRGGVHIDVPVKEFNTSTK